MKIKKIIVDMENGEEKDFIPKEGIMLLVGDFKVDDKEEQIVLEQTSDDPGIQLTLLKRILNHNPVNQSNQNKDDKEVVNE